MWNSNGFIVRKRRTTEYITYHNTMAALTAIIADSCPDIFYKVLHNPDLGYTNRTPPRICRPLLEHVCPGQGSGN